MMGIKFFSSCFGCVFAFLLTPNAQAENTTPKQIPKWKQEHMAKVANAAKVCASPTVNPKANPNDITTGFYNINLIPDALALYLDADDNGKPSVINSTESKRQWLISQVGAGLYKISACFDQKPLCLSATQNKEIVLQTCDDIGYGNQVWWLKGFLHGANAGGWYLGSDGVGQMECLITGDGNNGLVLETCSNDQDGWRFNRTTKRAAASAPSPKPSISAFPKGAYVIDYQCKSGELVNTYYDDTNGQMHVRYKDEMLVLEATQSGSGAKFGSKGQPWGWWTKGRQGSIYQTNADETFIENCQEVIAENDDPVMPSDEPERIWTAYAQDGHVSVADCADCEEDLGVLIECQGANKPALMSIYWLADPDSNNKNATEIQVKLGDALYQRTVDTIPVEMLGNLHQFQLAASDPIITGLENENEVHFILADSQITIGLRGSKKALNTFKSNCGWLSL